MSVVSEIRLTVSKTINLGNYESVKIEGTVIVSKDNDLDTPESLMEQVLDQVKLLLNDARQDHVPKRRSREE